MRVSEDHSRSGEPVHVWRGDLAAWIQTSHVSVSKVVAKQVNEVWRGLLFCCSGVPVAKARIRPQRGREKKAGAQGGPERFQPCIAAFHGWRFRGTGK